ncbi:MAG TPA: phosphate ABC transporter substrate-binding protein [Planctomycetota bacterium]|nr:phosphate ABC transporter substrate-binding protein [Planctomycetota bacterium]
MLKTILGLLVLAAPFAPRQESIIAELKPYQKVDGVSGNLSSVGSDTMVNMMTLWAEGFRKMYPNVNIQVEGKGSSTAFPALIEGTAQLGPMSREAKPTEQDKFSSHYNYKATQLRTSLDALAVYVNKDNPLEEITLEQIDAIFSKGRKLRYKEDIKTWGQLGLKGDWANRPISAYGRNSASGTYGFFKEKALGGGDYKDTVKEMPGSATVVQSVTTDRYGIGYSGIGYATTGVKKLKLAEKAGSPFIAADAEDVYNDTYPLRRFLFVYINKAPGQPLSPLLREFCAYIFSKEGQQCVDKDGYFPVPTAVIEQELVKFR